MECRVNAPHRVISHEQTPAIDIDESKQKKQKKKNRKEHPFLHRDATPPPPLVGFGSQAALYETDLVVFALGN